MLIADGRLIADGPVEQVVTAAALSELYGVPVRVLTATDDATGRPVYACAPVAAGDDR